MIIMYVTNLCLCLAVAATFVLAGVVSAAEDETRADIQGEPVLLRRLRREGWSNSWKLISPGQQCYARPCGYDADCCRGYECSGFSEIERRTKPIRTCAPILGELDEIY